jgi:outer membrane protein OmpA-like peptidoglycan-associated protein
MIAARRGDPKATEKALTALFDLEPERRLVIERDPTFFRMRIHGNVAALFSAKKMADAKVAAEKKKKGEKVEGKGTLLASTSPSTKLSVPGGPEKTIGEQIHFDFDSAAITADSKATLDEIATFLKSQKGLEYVEITGHADRRGEEAYNIKLSSERAEAVRTALVSRGVPASMLKTKGYGIYCPLDDGDDESAFAKNRRVQFAISAGGKIVGEELTCNERMRKWLKPGAAVKLTASK